MGWGSFALFVNFPGESPRPQRRTRPREIGLLQSPGIHAVRLRTLHGINILAQAPEAPFGRSCFPLFQIGF